MTNAELLQLHPQHLAELKSLSDALKFDNVDIVAKETVVAQKFTTESFSLDFGYHLNQLEFDAYFRGEDHMHAIFIGKKHEDDTFYCLSYARADKLEERIIFKLTVTRSDCHGNLETCRRR